MNEREILHKRVLPFLEQIGYLPKNIEIEKRIEVGNKKSLYPDIVAYLDNRTIAFVLDTKKPHTFLPNYKTQIISYGLLMQTSYSVLSDGYQSIIYETKTGTAVYQGDLDGLRRYLSKQTLSQNQKVIDVLTPEEERRAKKTLISFQKEESFVELLHSCENIIRDEDGKVGEDAFSELSKILFVKIYAERENLTNLLTDESISILFENAKKSYANLFKSDDIISLSDNTKAKLVALLKHYSFVDTEIDIKGKAFEIFIGNTLTGKLGQFFTPRTVVQFMVGFMPPSYKTESHAPNILDPCCGSGGFLIEILNKLIDDISRNEDDSDREAIIDGLLTNQIHGVDTAPSLVRTCKMNMVLHGDGQGGIHRLNGLDLTFDKYTEYLHKFDYIYTNPPFGQKDDDTEILQRFTLGRDAIKSDAKGLTNKGVEREVLFIELYNRLLKKGGRCAVVLPNVILNGKKRKSLREYIADNFVITAIIGLPDRTFKSSGANSHTSIVFLKKKKDGERQKEIFMAIAKEIGYERKTKKALQTERNDLEKILDTYKNYLLTKGGDANGIQKLGDNCWIVPSGKIEDRIDANYYYARYIIEVPNSQFLISVCDISTEKLHNTSDTYKYIQFSDESENWGAIVSYTSEGKKDELPQRAQMIMRKGDVLCAKLFDSEKNIVIISNEYDKQIASTGFAVLRATNIPYQILYYLMRLESTREQIRYFCRGTILPTCDDQTFANIRVPQISTDKQEKIVRFVNEIENDKENIKQKIEKLPAL